EPERRAEQIERVVAERPQGPLPDRRKLFPLVVFVRRLRRWARLLGGGDGRAGQSDDDQSDCEQPHGPTDYHLWARRRPLPGNAGHVIGTKYLEISPLGLGARACG